MGHVVHNTAWGGFSLSKLAAMWLAGKGFVPALKWLNQYPGLEGDEFNECFFAHDVPRHHPLLISCINTIGLDNAAGAFSNLQVTKVKDLYKIVDDIVEGVERVIEPTEGWSDRGWISSRSIRNFECEL